ncbi:hypothetical protein [Methanofollis aquaemaris]|nr:hypothetical protein [Methanofollis aquaemaris]
MLERRVHEQCNTPFSCYFLCDGDAPSFNVGVNVVAWAVAAIAIRKRE